jgi:hypothetical protein
VIYADILISWFLAAVLEIYTQHFTRRLHFTQQQLLMVDARINFFPFLNFIIYLTVSCHE